MPKPWHKNSEKELRLYVVLLRNDGFSDASIGEFFGTTKGTCVGFRHRKLPKFIDIARATKDRVPQSRFNALLNDEAAKRAAQEIIDANEGVESSYVHRFGQRKKIRRKTESRKAAASVPQQLAPLPDAHDKVVQKSSEKESPPDFGADIAREAARAPVSTPISVQEAPRLREPRTRPEEEQAATLQSGCQWPIGIGSLKRPDLCRAECEPGEKLCPVHKAGVKKLNRAV